jgi:hypothetical protein
MQTPTRKLAPRFFRIAHTSLWAALAVWTAMVVVSIPRMTQAQAAAERQRAFDLAAEGSFYCGKWGLVPGSHEHTLCTMDVQEIRDRQEQRRLAEQTAF